MEPENHKVDFNEKTVTQRPRPQSSLSIKYSAEVQVIQQRWGSLEDVRKRLGLSQRKIAQLLMVDPSAWTRWTKKNQTAPPHIYRALSWFLLLQEKHPEAHPNIWLASVTNPHPPKEQITETIDRITEQSLRKIERLIKNRRKRFFMRYGAAVAIAIFLSTISACILALNPKT